MEMHSLATKVITPDRLLLVKDLAHSFSNSLDLRLVNSRYVEVHSWCGPELGRAEVAAVIEWLQAARERMLNPEASDPQPRSKGEASTCPRPSGRR